MGADVYPHSDDQQAGQVRGATRYSAKPGLTVGCLASADSDGSTNGDQGYGQAN